MGRKKSVNRYLRAAQNLGLINNKTVQNITTYTKKEPARYPITECLNVLKNLWAKPDYTELTISNYAWYKLMAFIHLVGDYEISGFGRIQKMKYTDGKERDTVTDFDIIRQEVKSAYVESDEDAVLEFIMKLPAEQRNEWTLDWHSHVEMATSPSTTDWTNYGEMLKARLGKQFPIMIVNKKASVTSYQIISEARHDAIKVSVIEEPLSSDEIEKIYNECKEKVETLCSRPRVSTYSTYGAAAKTTSAGWGGSAGYDYDYDYYDHYNRGYKAWWEKDEDDTEPDISKTVKQVEESETEYEMTCAECGKPLNPQIPEEINMGVCSECFEEALK